MILDKVLHTIESAAPLKWQEAWDNSGLQVGDRNADIHKALLTMDITEAVVREAVQLHCDLIISHHPLLFHPLKSITNDTPQERCVRVAIQHGIAIYSAHTNMDAWLHGVSGRMAEMLGMRKYHILVDDGASEHSGKCTRNGEEYGLGVIGELDEPMAFTALLERVRNVFNTTYIRYIEGKPTIQRIAICGGAGADLIDTAIQQQADVFITADIKYHEFCNAEGQIALIDIDHWISEHYTRDIYKELLEGQIETVVSKADRSPVKVNW